MPAPSQKAREWARWFDVALRDDQLAEDAERLDSFTLELREALREACEMAEEGKKVTIATLHGWVMTLDSYSPEEEKG